MTTNNPVTAAKTSIIAREPVLAGTAATWLLLQVGAILVGRTHLLTTAEWTPLSSAVAPIVTGAVLALIGLLVRRVVTPAEKVYSEVSAWLDEKGLIVPGGHAAEPAPAVVVRVVAPNPSGDVIGADRASAALTN